MSCLWTIIFLSFIFLSLSEAKHQNKLHSAVVVGTVYCDTCFHQDFSKASHFISGATVAVECEDTGSRPGFRQEVKTNEHGEFKVNLPFSVSKHVKKIRGCSVKLIRSGEPYCAVAATATSSSLHLKSRKEGTHIFSAGFFTFKPLKQPELCDQKPIIKNSKELDSEKSLISNPNDPTFVPPIQDPPSDPPALGQFLPPLPQLPNLPPLPRLPNLPPLPGMPNLPPAVPKKATAKDSTKASELMDKKVTDSLFFPPNPLNPPILPIPPNPLLPPPSILPIPPNPLLPPPSILPIPPNPLLPPPSILPIPPNPLLPPPSILPPIFPSPPPSIIPPILPTPSPPSFNLPPLIPGLTPSPPPPAPTFPFVPLPPFPFQPTPGFPGVPPADVSSPSKTTSPSP
ncbi:vegetative cell wall protein gp1-like [Forsythia ovata]|uniref:Vegetative cell wall protein gp1-like n=1 Tax=Forsythia ovata TaxID=205694 RepID=A0ABD1UD76_9LAMI